MSASPHHPPEIEPCKLCLSLVVDQLGPSSAGRQPDRILLTNPRESATQLMYVVDAMSLLISRDPNSR